MHDCFHQERHAGCAKHIINILPYSGPENFLADGAINKWAFSGLLTFQFTLPWGIWGQIKMVLNLHSSYIWTMQRPFQQQHKLILIWNSVCVFKSLCWFLLSMWMDILLSPVNGFFSGTFCGLKWMPLEIGVWIFPVDIFWSTSTMTYKTEQV